MQQEVQMISKVLKTNSGSIGKNEVENDEKPLPSLSERRDFSLRRLLRSVMPPSPSCSQLLKRLEISWIRLDICDRVDEADDPANTEVCVAPRSNRPELSDESVKSEQELKVIDTKSYVPGR